MIVGRISGIIKKQNPKTKIKLTYESLKNNDIQIDILQNDIIVNIENLNEILDDSGYRRLFLTIKDNVKLNIHSTLYGYVIRTGINCEVISVCLAKTIPIFMELGEGSSLVYSGSHDIKRNKNCKVTHMSKIKNAND